jgi:hypothetical protein
MSALSFCSYVSGVGRQCWGPLAPCSRVAAAWCRTRLVLSCSAPLLCFPVPVSALEPRPCSPSLLVFFWTPSPARLLVERTPSPPFPSSPTPTHAGRAPWPMPSPPRVPLVTPSTPHPFSVRCTATSAHQAINAPVLASPPSHPQIRSRARRITLLRQCSGGRGSGAVGKEVVGGRATRSSRCS